MLLQCLPVLRGSGQEITTDTRQQKLEMLVQQKSIISELFESDTIDVSTITFCSVIVFVRCYFRGHKNRKKVKI